MSRFTPLLGRRRAAPAAPAALLPTQAAWSLLGWLYAAAGALGLAATTVAAASPGRLTHVVRAVDGLAIVVAAVLVLGARRLPRAALGPFLATSTLLISVAIGASGGGSTAVAYACFCFIGPVYARFVLSQRQADVQLLVAVGLGAPVLAVQPMISVGEQAIVWGICLMLTGAVAWLVAALLRSERDQLTGLPNRRGLERMLEAATAGARDTRVALAVLEVGGLAEVNRERGREAGDDVLVQLARSWSAQLPTGASLARTGGTGFAVVAPRSALAPVTELAERLRTTVPGTVGACAGTALWERGESAAALLLRAEAAVAVARSVGGGSTHEHPGIGQEGRELRAALAAQELVVHFQPIVALDGSGVVGAEALVRWQHPERGLLMPGTFLPEVERCGLVVELGRSVLQQACAAAAAWPAGRGGTVPYLSVNASGEELGEPGYAWTVETALMASGLPPTRLMVELVESDYDASSAVVGANLARLRELGVRTAVDDFGTGYSSLDRLRGSGTDVLKIDRSFIADIANARQEAPLVSAALALASALGMTAVAEGVETLAQAGWLHSHGCPLAQGWLYSRAVPQEAFLELAGTLAVRPGRAGTTSGSAHVVTP